MGTGSLTAALASLFKIFISSKSIKLLSLSEPHADSEAKSFEEIFLEKRSLAQ